MICKIKSIYERKLVMDIIKPVGATKRPPDYLITNLIANCTNSEPNVIVSLLTFVLKDSEVEWISKLVSLLVSTLLF